MVWCVNRTGFITCVRRPAHSARTGDEPASKPGVIACARRPNSPRGKVLKQLLTYYTGVVPRADNASANRCGLVDPRSRLRAWRGAGLALALALLPGPVPEACAQELAFPGGVLWQITFDPPPAQLPAFDDRSAYVVLQGGSVRAVDHASGSIRWTSPASSTVRPASSGRQLVGAEGVAAWALDAVSGREVWRRDLGANAAAVPAVTPDGAAFLTEKGDLVLLSWADGREVWRAQMPARVSAPLAAGLDRVWVGLDDGRVMAIRLTDGATAWTRPLGARILGMTPIGDRLFAGASDNFLYALRARDGDLAWRWRTGGDVVGEAVADGRQVYFTSLDAMLRAVDRRHGDLRWQRALTTRAVGGPALAGTQVILAGVSPELRAFRTSDGGMAASTPVPGRPLHGPFLAAAAAAAPARLILLTAGGHLLAIGQTVEPSLVPLDILPWTKLPPEELPVIKR
jgi:outer membrane protein assembly factor BamB